MWHSFKFLFAWELGIVRGRQEIILQKLFALELCCNSKVSNVMRHGTGVHGPWIIDVLYHGIRLSSFTTKSNNSEGLIVLTSDYDVTMHVRLLLLMRVIQSAFCVEESVKSTRECSHSQTATDQWTTSLCRLNFGFQWRNPTLSVGIEI